MYNNTAAVNTVMGLMSHLPGSELKEILNNEEKFEQYAKELKPVSDCYLPMLPNYFYLIVIK